MFVEVRRPKLRRFDIYK